MKQPLISPIHNPLLLKKAMQLAATGKIIAFNNNFIYLKISDAWIHQLFPYLYSYKVNKPNYFNNILLGAHISIFYPEEQQEIQKNEIGQKHDFEIKEIVKATLGTKNYFALLVEAPSLIQIRAKYGLPPYLCFKGYAINFHITIAVNFLMN